MLRKYQICARTVPLYGCISYGGSSCLVTAGLECKIPDKTPARDQSTSHRCRGECGGSLHGWCGLQDPEGDSEIHPRGRRNAQGNGVNNITKTSTTRWNRSEPPGDLRFLLPCISYLIVTAHHTSTTSGRTYSRAVLFCLCSICRRLGLI